MPLSGEEILSFSRYVTQATWMRKLLDQELLAGHPKIHGEMATEVRVPMDLWYGCLYVIVEAWQQLNLVDDEVELLLGNEEFVDALRRARNGAFHFQPKFWDDRFLALLRGGGESAVWVRQLHDALVRQSIELMRSHDHEQESS